MAACKCGARHWIIVGDKPLGMVDVRGIGRVMAYEIEARFKEEAQPLSADQAERYLLG